MTTRLDIQRGRVQDDLRGLIDGDVRCDDVFVHLFASDSSMYEVRPLGVVFPRSLADVVACVRYAEENGIPVHCRGAGTGHAGGALGPGLILDLSRHMRRVVAVDENSVRAQAGIVVERLNAFLTASQNRAFLAASGNPRTTTLGAAIAVDGNGPFALREGRPARHLLEMQVVLPNGTVLELRSEQIPALRERTTRAELLTGQASAVALAPALQAIARGYDSSPDVGVAGVCGCGYRLREALAPDGTVDLMRLFAGSEGTLGVVTEVRVATRALPRHEAALLFYFDRIEKALLSVPEILRQGVAGCDLVDRRRLSMIREDSPRMDRIAPSSTEAVLLLELADEDGRDLRQRIEQLIDAVRSRDKLAFGQRYAVGGTGHQDFRRWLVATQISLGRARGPVRPVPLADDVAVHPDLLPDCLDDIRTVVKRHRTACSVAGRVGLGQLRVDPLVDFAEPEVVKRMHDLSEELHEAIAIRGGRFGVSDGCGLLRTSLFARWFANDHAVCREVKRLIDPRGILNPGKIVQDPSLSGGVRLRSFYVQTAGSAVLDRTVDDAERGPAVSSAIDPIDAGDVSPRRQLELQLNWDPSQLADAALSCDACGECRCRVPGERACPMFRLLPVEEAAPRSKSQIVLGLLSGRVPLERLTSEDMRDVVDLCVHCHLCRTECPCQIDIPRLVARCKAAHVAAHGLPLGDRVMARIDQLLAAAQVAVWPLNWAVGERRIRWLMEKVFGIAQGRKLPRMHNLSYLSRVIGQSVTQPSRRGGLKVALFIDTYSNYFDVRLIDQVVAVLRHNGVQVYVPPRQRGSGTQAIVLGDLERGARLARHNVALLADAVRQGYQIVTVEPSSAACLRFEYPTLLDDEDVDLVAANVMEICGFLWNLHRQGKLRLDFRPLSMTVGYHEPCRMAALGDGSPGEELLRLIPGLTVHRIEAGCCGMAGGFGLRKTYYRASLRAGRILMREMRSPLLHLGATECPACKIQMEQGAPKRTVHPIRLLAMAYGIAPDDGRLFKVPRNRLIVS